MSKPLEQRIGGPNSINSLIERGFLSMEPVGCHAVQTFMVEGQEFKVKPTSVTFRPGQPDERTVTVFKPVHHKVRGGLR